MKLLLSVAFVAVATAMTPVSLWTEEYERIPGEYIVQFKPEARAQFESFLTKRDMFAGMMNTYDFGDFMGFSAQLNDKELFQIQNTDGLLSVEPNIKMYAYGDQSPATWGIDRSDQRALPLNNRYRWRDNAAGQNVTVFILDTGILTTHSNFGGRATFGADCTGRSCTTGTNPQDPQGHGTHCAGTAISTTYGIAKEAKAVNIRVLGSNGSGSTAGIVNGIQYVVNQFSGKRIISMSLGGGISTALDNAVNSAFNSGVISICAAGNSNNNACNGSPGRAQRAFTVAASDSRDRKASFSSYGSCVDLWAPGVSILSTSNRGGTTTLSGTSMSTPHVAGAAALIHSRGSFSPSEIASTLTREATENAISGNPSGTPNLLLFTSPDGF